MVLVDSYFWHPTLNMAKHPIHIDYETRSQADIGDVGAYRYAEDESTEIMCAALAVGDERPAMWINPRFEVDDGLFTIKTEPRAWEIMSLMQEPDRMIYAHNAQFELAITHFKGAKHGFFIRPEQLRCTAAMCRRGAIPARLKDATAALFRDESQQKDKDGSRLIQKFSIPRDGLFRDPRQHCADWLKFVEYCRQDVVVEQLLTHELNAFGMTGAVLDTFLFDMQINHYGLEVNIEALHNAQKIIEHVEAELTEQFVELTGFNPTQREVLLQWLKDRGYKGEDMTAGTVETELARMEEGDAKTALSLRQKLSFASIKKVRSMIACACEDGRVRGTLQYYGAATGRWSGRLIQPQNFKRPTIKHTDAAYKAICEGISAADMELFYGPPLEVIGSCIRHFIQPKQGVLLDVDFAAIEARLVCWLAGQQDALDEFAAGIDRYKIMASKIYGVPVDEVNAHPQRFVGKQCVLGCGYSMGGSKFRGTCASYNYELPWVADVVNKETGETVLTDVELIEAEQYVAERKSAGLSHFDVLPFENKCVKAYRDSHKEVVSFWYEIERACKTAITTPGAKVPVRKVTVFCANTAGSKYLFIVLPSGRRLAYRDPQIVEVYDAGEEEIVTEDGAVVQRKKRKQITFWGQLEGKTMWGRVKTYGGKLVENITQAVAADLMSNGAINAQRTGIQIATMIHDQCLAYCRDADEAPKMLALLEKCLTTLPKWAEGFPVAVDGKITPYYRK